MTPPGPPPGSPRPAAPTRRLGPALGLWLCASLGLGLGLGLGGCRRSTEHPAAARADAGAQGPKGAAAAQAPVKDPEEACVDAWLAARKLDRYGQPEGTVYAGGTPLFDEGTGEEVDRLVYVYGQQPGAQAACAPETPAEPGRDGGADRGPEGRAAPAPGVDSPP